MKLIRSHKELEVYKLAYKLAKVESRNKVFIETIKPLYNTSILQHPQKSLLLSMGAIYIYCMAH